MGYDAEGTLTFEGHRYRGTARLEHKDLTFRGDTRLTIPLSDIVEVHARAGTLFLAFGERRAVLTIGSEAEKWARRIAHPPTRVEKLGVKNGMRVAVLRVPDAALRQEIESRGALLSGARSKDLDLIFFGVRTSSDLLRLGALRSRLKPSGAIWVIRGKGKGSAISEAASMAAGKRAGLVDVKVVSFSETQSAEKYVIPVAKRAGSAHSSFPRPGRRGSRSSRDRT